MRQNGYDATVQTAGQKYRGYTQKRPAAEERLSAAGFSDIGIERFAVWELLFNPGLLTKFASFLPLATMVQNCVSYAPRPMQRELLASIVVCGEGSTVRGFRERLESEIAALYPSMRNNIQVESVAGASSAWQGAKLFASRSTFLKQCTNQSDLGQLSSLGHRFF